MSNDDYTEAQPDVLVLEASNTVAASPNTEPPENPVALVKAMRVAISRVAKIDVAKEMHDRAKAFAEYYAAAHDPDMEREFQQVRIRAQRRMGQILNETEVAKGGGGYQSRSTTSKKPLAKTLARLGVTKDQSALYKRLAKGSEEEFEAVLHSPKPLSTALVLRTLDPQPKPDDDLKQERNAIKHLLALSKIDPETLGDFIYGDPTIWRQAHEAIIKVRLTAERFQSLRTEPVADCADEEPGPDAAAPTSEAA